MRKTDTKSRMNALLLSLAGHALLILIASLFVVTKEVVPTDFLQVEWVKLPRQMRRIKTMEVKPVQPRVIKPKVLSTHRVTPTAKPLDIKTAASRSFVAVRENSDLAATEIQTAEICTVAQIPAKAHEITLSPKGDEGASRRGRVAGGTGNAPGRGKGTGKRGGARRDGTRHRHG